MPLILVKSKKYKSPDWIDIRWTFMVMAVAQGFEPWVAVTLHNISSVAPSAARTRHHQFEFTYI